MREAEKLNRGLIVSVNADNTAFLSWRLLLDDKANQAFDVYKRMEGESSFSKLNNKPLRQGTNFSDATYQRGKACDYCVLPAGTKPNDKNLEAGSSFHLEAQQGPKNYRSIPLQTPEGYRPGDCSLGDLNGDGQYEIIVKQESTPR
ncbi:MAG: hypothetical protein J6Q26_09120, partial [Bacteroidales bacterium]|nr:hypothetical protein [Bacteroidales bacterium]